MAFETAKLFGTVRPWRMGTRRPFWPPQPMATLWRQPWPRALPPGPGRAEEEVLEQAPAGQAVERRRRRSPHPGKIGCPQRGGRQKVLS